MDAVEKVQNTEPIENKEEVFLKERVILFADKLKKNYNWLVYVLLAAIVWLSFHIRTSNIPNLKDITTGTWTLGPDLDPFLFLRWAEYIVQHGKIFAIDMMRYSPLGLSTQEEYLLHPYMMAWFHKIFALLGSESITYSSIVYPAFFFVLTTIAFFFMTRVIFSDIIGMRKANLIALVSSFFLSIFPSLLPRTIAGIPEKESVAFLFLFLAFFFFIKSWKHKQLRFQLIYAFLAGLATAGMAQVWGGYLFIFYIIAASVGFAFLFGHTERQIIYSYSVWIATSFLFMVSFSTRYSLKSLLTGLNTLPAVLILLAMIVHQIIYSTKIQTYLRRPILDKIPQPLISLGIVVLISLLSGSLIGGTDFIVNSTNYVIDNLITPATSRLIQTVAENRQPFFDEWASSFGPQIANVYLFFALFFFGSIFMVYFVLNKFEKKERVILTSAYTFFVSAVAFSRISDSSVFNGTNFQSLAFYALGFIALIFLGGYYYLRNYKHENGREALKNVNLGYILTLSFLILTMISARGAVRLILMLVPPASILASYFVVEASDRAIKSKEQAKKLFFGAIAIIAIIAMLFSAYVQYQEVSQTAPNYAPSVYTQQWQKAMAWVRENTQENAVFGHWWDYGYWLQSIGERATVLDGGNAISYWNHLMGRYALTGTSNQEALEFLYAHNTTHFLIDSTDIGKYAAYSRIGSDPNYDRISSIPNVLRDSSQVQETKNGFIAVYTGGFGTDSDIFYTDPETGKEVILPGGRTGVGAILVEFDDSGNIISNPTVVFIYQNEQIRIPIRYAYDNNLKDFGVGSGIEAAAYVFPRVSQDGSLDPIGALIYLSERTVKSQMVRLYLYQENNGSFILVHSEDDIVVQQIKSQDPSFSKDIIYFQGVRGPIRIWEINYPSDIEYKPEFIETYYPPEILFA